MPRREFVVPCETPKRVPVSLSEMVACPIPVRAGIRHARYSGQAPAVEGAVDDVRHGRTSTACVCVRVEAFSPHWGEEHEVVRKAQVFLCDLKLEHELSVRHRSEKGVKRFRGWKSIGPFFTCNRTFEAN